MLLDHNYNARLTDFGYASMIGDIPEALRYIQMTTMKPGTIRWAAPEHFAVDAEMTHPTTKSDMYSFGNLGLLASAPSRTTCVFSPHSRYCLGSTRGQRSDVTRQSSYYYRGETSLRGLCTVQSTTNIGNSSSVVGQRSMTVHVRKRRCLFCNNLSIRPLRMASL